MIQDIIRKSMTFFLVALTILFFYNNLLADQTEKKKITILKFTANNIPQSIADSTRDIFEVQLYNTNAFEILERTQVDVILKEHNFDNQYCSDEDCAVKIGKLLAADKIVVGSVNKVGGYTVIIKYIDIEKGRIEYADSKKVESESEIADVMRNLANEAAIRIKKMQYQKLKPVNYYLRGAIPGLGQIYAGQDNKGIIFMGLFAVSGIYTGYAIYDYKQKREAYDDLKTGSREEFKRKYDKSEEAYQRANIAIIVTSVIYLINWVDILFFSKPEFNTEIIAGHLKIGNTLFACSINNPGRTFDNGYMEYMIKAGFIFIF